MSENNQQDNPLEEVVNTIQTTNASAQRPCENDTHEPVEVQVLELFELYESCFPKSINKQRKKAQKAYSKKGVGALYRAVDNLLDSYITFERGNVNTIEKHVSYIENKIELRKQSRFEIDKKIVDANNRYAEIRQELGIPSDYDSAEFPPPFDPPHGSYTPDPEGHDPFATMGELDRFPYEALVAHQENQGDQEGQSSLEKVKRLRREMLDISSQMGRYTHEKERTNDSIRTLRNSLGDDKWMLKDREKLIGYLEVAWEDRKDLRQSEPQKKVYGALANFVHKARSLAKNVIRPNQDYQLP